MKMFCLPHAGGSCSAFIKLKKYLSPELVLLPIELAGRGSRINEPFPGCIEAAAADAYRTIRSNLDEEPYMILGHSMGCWIAYETLILLAAAQVALPQRMIMSSNYPPHLGNDAELLSELSDEDFMRALNGYGAMPPEVFREKHLRDIFLPILRSDFKMLEAYGAIGRAAEQHPCAFSVYFGKDENVDTVKLQKWSQYTTKELDTRAFYWTHMYLFENPGSVCRAINNLSRENIDER